MLYQYTTLAWACEIGTTKRLWGARVHGEPPGPLQDFRTPDGQFGATYVASFSSEPNKLSQWPACCPGGGYALGFRTEALKVIARNQGFRLVQCSYDRDQHVAEARAIANQVVKRIEDLPPNILAVLEPGGSYSPQTIQSWPFRIRQEMPAEIVPYVEIRLDDPAELQVSGMTAVLGHVYVGPCAEPEIAVGSLMHLFEANRMSCPQFTLS